PSRAAGIRATRHLRSASPASSLLRWRDSADGGAMDTPTTLLTGVAMGESPRWHGDRLWFSDWGAQQIVVVRHDGQREITDVPFELPFCIDWLHDDRLLIVAGREGRLVRREFDASLVTHADLRRLGEQPWNGIVVDGR